VRLHKRRLSCRMRGFEPVSQGGILRVSEPVDSVALQGGELPYQSREVAGRVPDYVLRVLRTPLQQPNHLPEIR
jgi:hypothetical protein